MTVDQYAQLSNHLMGSAFAVLCIAFVCHLAEWVSVWASRRSTEREKALVGEGAPAVADAPASAADSSAPPLARGDLGPAVRTVPAGEEL